MTKETKIELKRAQHMTNGAENNVIAFPQGRTGGNRGRPAMRDEDMVKDFIAIANYLDAVADRTGWRLWVTGLAREMRSMAQNIRRG